MPILSLGVLRVQVIEHVVSWIVGVVLGSSFFLGLGVFVDGVSYCHWSHLGCCNRGLLHSCWFELPFTVVFSCKLLRVLEGHLSGIEFAVENTGIQLTSDV